MIDSLTFDATTALLLSHLEVDELGQVRARRALLRRRRRYLTQARIRRLLA